MITHTLQLFFLIQWRVDIFFFFFFLIIFTRQIHAIILFIILYNSTIDLLSLIIFSILKNLPIINFFRCAEVNK